MRQFGLLFILLGLFGIVLAGLGGIAPHVMAQSREFGVGQGLAGLCLVLAGLYFWRYGTEVPK